MDRRRIVNAFLGVWLAVLLIDGFRPLVPLQGWLHDRIEPALDVTGLWQGAWRMYCPPDRRNIRFAARLELTGGRTVDWQSPDWTELSFASKFVHARRMNYFSYLQNVADDRLVPAWEGLADYLARNEAEYVSHVALSARIADVPDVDTQQVPARPYLAFGPPVFLVEWKP